EEFIPSQCDILFNRQNSRRLIESCLQRHLFLAEIKPGVYRYDTLFREFLREHFHTIQYERYQSVSVRVAEMYAVQQQWMLAFEVYRRADKLDLARQVVQTIGEHLYAMGRLETLEHWFQMLPEDDLDAS